MTVDSSSQNINKVCKYEVWCVSLHSALLSGGAKGYFPTPYPNCGPVHELTPMNNCCHPPGDERLHALTANQGAELTIK